MRPLESREVLAPMHVDRSQTSVGIVNQRVSPGREPQCYGKLGGYVGTRPLIALARAR